jgi:hypothetical protein
MRSFEEMDTLLEIGRKTRQDGLPQNAMMMALSARDQFAARVAASPLVQAWKAHIAASFPNGRNTCGWHARAEQIAAAGGVAMAGAVPAIAFHTAPPDDHPILHAVGLATLISLAQVYLWRVEAEQTAMAAPEPPPCILDRTLLPYPIMFWSLETAWTFANAKECGLRPTVEVNWYLIAHQGDHLGIRVAHDLTDQQDKTIRIVESGLRYGTRWPDDYHGIARQGTGNLLRHLAFLRSPYVVTDPQGIPRHFRRQWSMARDDHDTTHVVTLRRDAAERVRAFEAASREYRHRWWVAGHYRNQWYPSVQLHRPVWIAPYLKGDPDAPMLEKVYAVKR